MFTSESFYTAEEELADLREFILHVSNQLWEATDPEAPDVRFMDFAQLRKYAFEQDVVVGFIFQELEALIAKHRIRELRLRSTGETKCNCPWNCSTKFKLCCTSATANFRQLHTAERLTRMNSWSCPKIAETRPSGWRTCANSALSVSPWSFKWNQRNITAATENAAFTGICRR